MIAFQLLVMKVLDNGLTAYTPRPGYKQFCRTIASSIKYVCALLAYLQLPSAICIHSIPSFDFLHQISAESNNVLMQKISSVNGYDKRIFFSLNYHSSICRESVRELCEIWKTTRGLLGRGEDDQLQPEVDRIVLLALIYILNRPA